MNSAMVDWKRIELIVGPESEAHIKKHGVSISEVFNILNSRTYSRKIKTGGETRYTVLGESYGRILMVVLEYSSHPRGSICLQLMSLLRDIKDYIGTDAKSNIMKKYTQEERDLAIKEIEAMPVSPEEWEGPHDTKITSLRYVEDTPKRKIGLLSGLLDKIRAILHPA